MNTTFRKHKIAAVLLLSSIGVFANLASASESKLADEYMKAYATFDVDKLSTFYSDNAVFTDPTSEIWGEYAWNMNGKKAIVKRMKSFFSEFDKASVEYNVKEKYESAGYTIYTGKAKFAFVKKGVLETSCLLVTTIISTNDGKVTEHRDYLDYDNLETSKKVGDQSC